MRVIADVALRRVHGSERGNIWQDIHQAAWIGAIKAVDGYDPARGASLGTYAQHKIQGAVLDYFRENDKLSRKHRLAIKEGKSQPIREIGPPKPNAFVYFDPSFRNIEMTEDVRRIMKACKFNLKEIASIEMCMRTGTWPKRASWMLAKFHRIMPKLTELTTLGKRKDR